MYRKIKFENADEETYEAISKRMEDVMKENKDILIEMSYSKNREVCIFFNPSPNANKYRYYDGIDKMMHVLASLLSYI